MDKFVKALILVFGDDGVGSRSVGLEIARVSSEPESFAKKT